MAPLVPLVFDLVRLARVATGVSIVSPHCLSAGVFNKSPSSSLFEKATSPFRRVYGVGTGGEGVESGAEDGAVVPDDADGTRSLAGVNIPEPIDSDNSGIVPEEWFREASGRELSAADMTPYNLDSRL